MECLENIRSYPIRENEELIKILLKDRTTNKNIIWASESYNDIGYKFNEEISEEMFKHLPYHIIKPRVAKEEEEKIIRTKRKGEVFTPSWIVKKKLDLLESELLKLDFEEYINYTYLEITCGEAPYITSRYDAVTGEYIELENRVGFLDRKLQIISKKIHDEKTWFKWAIKAYKSSYGYEYQGDSLFIARENLLKTFIDFYNYKFNSIPDLKKLKLIAEIISYNIFQMDGLKYTIPVKAEIKSKKITKQLSFFGEMEDKEEQLEIVQKKGDEVQFKNWEDNRLIRFADLNKNGGSVENMKFDVVIGNPPYQDKTIGDNKTYSPPIYHFFLDNAYALGNKVIMIHPARFLFNAGSTPKAWNKRMLNDEKIKVIYYSEDSKKIFSSTDIKGGIAISYRDNDKIFGPIKIFIPSEKLRSIVTKVCSRPSFRPLSKLVYAPESYKFTDELHKDFPDAKNNMSKGHKYGIMTNIFKTIDFVFESDVNNKNEYYKVYGRENNKRTSKWIKRDYIANHDNLNKFKLLLAKSNGSGIFGEKLSDSIVAKPCELHTQTYISFGKFETKIETINLQKYIKTKFVRALLGVLKITQDNKKKVWEKVPIQDFTSNSDIDWTKSISEIDKQLYEKYRLSQEEIDFIESNVKEME